jgi:hypothetical protein
MEGPSTTLQSIYKLGEWACYPTVVGRCHCPLYLLRCLVSCPAAYIFGPPGSRSVIQPPNQETSYPIWNKISKSGRSPPTARRWNTVICLHDIGHHPCYLYTILEYVPAYIILCFTVSQLSVHCLIGNGTLLPNRDVHLPLSNYYH